MLSGGSAAGIATRVSTGSLRMALLNLTAPNLIELRQLSANVRFPPVADGPLSTRAEHCRHREERGWLLRRSTSLQSEEAIVWRRRFFGGWRGRRANGSHRSGFGYSFGTVLLVISGALLLFLYLTGRLNF